ncbi:unnamed protein product [Pedinophyceae sp. YPF-701]|nr:unnamed protein product [Pedinophyceae sp. YPF-701]
MTSQAKEGAGKRLSVEDGPLHRTVRNGPASGSKPAPKSKKDSKDASPTADASDDSEYVKGMFGEDDHVHDEEEKLRLEREKKAKSTPKKDTPVTLDKKKYEQLDQLLNKTQLYSQFLAENIEIDRDEEPAKKKQKKSKASGADADAEEQAELCPLITGGRLKSYQISGIKWLASLYQNGLNGILADQMGLGKTVQTIGFLSHLRSHGIHGPFLIIAPLSTLPNWVGEVKRWTPTFPVVLYHGTKQERDGLRKEHMQPRTAGTETFPIVCTSFEVVIRDISALKKYNWKYVVVDEGHRLKNFDCKLVRELRTIPADNKLLLTGTPLQNNLAELWSLLNFLLPDLFDSLEKFESWFDFIGEDGERDQELVAQEQRHKVVTKLHAILQPFLLRRVKLDVAQGLPPKKEIVLYAGMTKLQKDLNKDLVDGTLREKLREIKESMGTGIGRAAESSINNVLMQMRKVCNHPDLITAEAQGDLQYPSPEVLLEQSGKMQLMERLLSRLLDRKHKVLIFSQMTKMLDLIDVFLHDLGRVSVRLDGSTSWQTRQELMRRFNEDDDVRVFLLSTRAGGLGINLTAADTVIIYDSDWNPHQDMQAMDRCHRIGQTKPVVVYRLVTAGSVDGRMLSRANSKLLLEKLIIRKGAFLDSGTAEKQQKKGKGKAGSDDASAELLQLLAAGGSTSGGVAESGVVSDEMLEKLMDRTHMTEKRAAPYEEPRGVGYEVVEQGDGAGLLTSVNS